MNDDFGKQVLRRLDNIEKTQKIQHEDRNILEDILLKIDASNREIGNLREEVKLLKDRVEKFEKNTKADNKGILEEVQEAKDNIEEITKSMGGE